MNTMHLEPNTQEPLAARAALSRQMARDYLRKAAKLAERGRYQDAHRRVHAANRVLAFAMDAEARLGELPDNPFIAPEISAEAVQESRAMVTMLGLKAAGRAAQRNDFGAAVTLAQEALAVSGLRLWPPPPTDANGVSIFSALPNLKRARADWETR